VSVSSACALNFLNICVRQSVFNDKPFVLLCVQLPLQLLYLTKTCNSQVSVFPLYQLYLFTINLHKTSRQISEQNRQTAVNVFLSKIPIKYLFYDDRQAMLHIQNMAVSEDLNSYHHIFRHNIPYLTNFGVLQSKL
jgi:hypothetical protein